MAEKMLVVCLPGMDGTGVLFERFVKAAPSWAECLVVNYPVDRALGYDQLVEWVMARVPQGRPKLLVAESFSGVVGVRVALRSGERVMGLVMVNSFLTPPGGGMMKVLPWKLMFSLPVSGHGVKAAMINGRSETPVEEVVRAGAMVSAEVMAFRAGLIARVDEREGFSRLRTPVLVLRGGADRIVQSGKSKEMVEAMAGGLENLNEFVTVKEIVGPHLLLQARPKEAWGVIEDWATGDNGLEM